MTPAQRLELLFELAIGKKDSAVTSSAARAEVESLVRSIGDRVSGRIVMACLLAKFDRPEVDPRKPYPAIGTPDSFDGRRYDEQYLAPFLERNGLLRSSQSAFLDPAYGDLNHPLTPELGLSNRFRLHREARHLLYAVATGLESAEGVFVELLRGLVAVRDVQARRIDSMAAELSEYESLPLSVEDTVSFVIQSLTLRNHRLPVLIVAAAYQSVSARLGEQPKPLTAHTAADEQTGAFGDVEITLVSDDRVRTVYEMKRKRVIREDIDRALQKVARVDPRPDNYIFVTTDPIDPAVQDYAASLYAATGGIEFAILDCGGFLRHFLHLFHRHRTTFLDTYQALVLSEPDSAVGFELKQAFLALRGAAMQPPTQDS